MGLYTKKKKKSQYTLYNEKILRQEESIFILIKKTTINQYNDLSTPNKN